MRKGLLVVAICFLYSCSPAQAGTFFATFDSVVQTNAFAHQGVATDGTNWWTTSEGATEPLTGNHHKVIHRFDSNWVLQATYDVTSEIPPLATQINGIIIKDGILYSGCNDWHTDATNSWIVEIDPFAGTNIATHLLAPDTITEGGDFWTDGEFYVIHHTPNEIHRYDSGWVLQELYVLGYSNDVHDYAQSGQFKGDYIFNPNHNSSLWPRTVDIYLFDGVSFEPAGRMIQPIWRGDGLQTDHWKASQGTEFGHDGTSIYFCVRNNVGGFNTGPHPVIKAHINEFVHTKTDEELRDVILSHGTNVSYYLQCRETFGTTAFDAGPKVNNFSLLGGNNFSTRGDISGPTKNVNGRGFYLSKSDHMTLGNSADVSFPTGESFSFGQFVYVTDMLAGLQKNGLLVGKGVSGDTPCSANHNYSLWYNFNGSGAIDFVMEEPDGTDHVVSTTFQAKEGTPYHIVCVRDTAASGGQGVMRIYVDGVLNNTNVDPNFPHNVNTHNLSFGALGDGASSSYAAVFEPFMVSKALTDSEVLQIYEATQNEVPFKPIRMGIY